MRPDAWCSCRIWSACLRKPWRPSGIFQMKRPPQKRLYWNRILLYVWPPLNFNADELHEIARRAGPGHRRPGTGAGGGAGPHSPPPDRRVTRHGGAHFQSRQPGLLMTMRPATKLQPLKPLAEYDQKVVKMRQHGLIYPYEIVKMLTPSLEDTRAEFPHRRFRRIRSGRASSVWFPSIVPTARTRPTSSSV